jgi:hypothetical protein
MTPFRFSAAHPRGRRRLPVKVVATLVTGMAIAVSIMGCVGDPAATNAVIVGGVVGGTLVGAQSPGQEIEQVYYLGIFDPQDQLPPAVYRITVHGQASAISGMKFGSGWVPASFIDSLNSNIAFQKESGQLTTTQGEDKQMATLKTGRRLMMFGPEGFREAPKDFRLVIVMGASPQAFFQAIDTSLGLISQVQKGGVAPAITQQLIQERQSLLSQQQRLATLKAAVDVEMAPAPGGSK